MLGDVSKWLRIFGQETILVRHKEDEKLILDALNKKAILVTSDKELCEKATKKGVKVIYLKPSLSLIEKLLKVFKESKLKPSLETSRCTVCGGELKRQEIEALKEIINSQEFWVCTRCGKLYWRGSHWKNIMKVYEQLCELLQKDSSV